MSINRDVAEDVSVGDAIVNAQVYSTGHPLYRNIMDSVEAKVAELTSQRSAAKSAGKPSVLTVALQPEEAVELANEYPELRILPYGAVRAAHPYWVASRQVANDWLTLQAVRLTSRVAHLGGSLATYLEAGLDEVQLLVDPQSATAVHERHSAGLACHNLYSDFVGYSTDLGRPAAIRTYEEHLRGEKVVYRDTHATLAPADVLCVDGGLYAYGPAQIAALMVSLGASMTYGFFPYKTEMLFNEAGEVQECDMAYVRTEDTLYLDYPQGIAGATAYSMKAWMALLSTHSFRFGDSAFQLELMKTRGCLMFYKMTRVSADVPAIQVVHSVEMPEKVPSYVIRSKRLKGLGLDPSKSYNWVDEVYIVAARLVDRLLEFALQLPKEQFTRFAIRKQVHVINDRVTVEGTSVKVNTPLGSRLVEALTVDVYSRAFSERYESGKLSLTAVRAVEEVASFGTSTRFQRAWLIACLCAAGLWEATLAPVLTAVGDAADVVRGFLASDAQVALPALTRAPTYMLWSDVKKGVPVVGNQALAAELSRQSGFECSGFSARWTRLISRLEEKRAQPTVRVREAALFTTQRASGGAADELISTAKSLNLMDEAPETRSAIQAEEAVRAVSTEALVDFEPVADPIGLLNEFYECVFPGVADQDLEHDTASISLDPQDRVLTAPYLRLPRYFGDAPKPKLSYRSKLRALGTCKRQNTLQELLSATAARNLNAPQVALPQGHEETAREVWDNFLRTMCVPEAAAKLKQYKADPVALEEGALREWMAQATPEKVDSVRKELIEKGEALNEMPVNEYLVMLKADVKPSLSSKPLHSRTEPQVIVYHEKPLSAFYSSIFRVLVRRFLSLLKPNIHVNLLKDTRDMEGFVRAAHPFKEKHLKYLENDFSKYDKSQSQFVWVLEQLVFSELGMNQAMLDKWLGGHVECNLRAVALGLSLHVMYQRKSGDATTAFGNVMLNVLSTAYAYAGTEIIWAIYMGDDSLICARAIGGSARAVQVLGEVFNLQAKTYVTDAPYFASNFVMIDTINEDVYFVPDPVKRIERWSMAVSGDDPQWEERFVSAQDAMGTYLNSYKTSGLPQAISERYGINVRVASGIAESVATLLSKFKNFRPIWESIPTMILY